MFLQNQINIDKNILSSIFEFFRKKIQNMKKLIEVPSFTQIFISRFKGISEDYDREEFFECIKHS